MRDKKIKLKEWHKFLIKLNISFLQAFLLFFIGLLISFFIFHFTFGDPILNRVGYIDPAVLEAERIRIGYYDPIGIQFLKYINNFFTGNWGNSYLLKPGKPVTEFLRESISNTFEIMLLPLLIGLGGFKLGSIWARKRKKVGGKILTPFITIGVSVPLIFLGPMLQIFFGMYTELPVMFRVTPGFSAPPYVTGFFLLDSIISGDWPLVFDVISHSILPWLILSIVITALILKQARTRIESDPRKNSIVSNSLIVGKMFGYLFVFTIIIDIMFILGGFCYWFLQSFFQGDPFVINGCILVIVILFSFTLLLANLVPITTEFIRNKISKKKAQTKAVEVGGSYKEKASKKINFKIELKNYLKSSLKSPYTIIGGSLMLFLVIGAGIYPLLGLSFPLEEILLPYISPSAVPFEAPSLGHPLGTTMYGYDVLARVVYGTQGAFLFGIIVVLIGLGGGSIFGVLAGKFHKYVYNSVIGPMILFFLFPSFLILALVAVLPVSDYQTITVVIGILTIPIFARIIANAIRRENNYIEIAKSIIKSIPLEVMFAILLYQALGFLGLSDPLVPQLGITLNWSRARLFTAFWANFWPGLFLFFITLSLIFLHEGLQAPASQKNISSLRSSRRTSVSDTPIVKSPESESELDMNTEDD